MSAVVALIVVLSIEMTSSEGTDPWRSLERVHRC
jgi:hypothetical protein